MYWTFVMPYRTIPDAVAAHSLGLELFVIGVTSFVNVSEVRLMSSPPQQENATYWLLPTFQTLDSVVEMIRNDLCTGRFQYNVHDFRDACACTRSYIYVDLTTPCYLRRYRWTIGIDVKSRHNAVADANATCRDNVNTHYHCDVDSCTSHNICLNPNRPIRIVGQHTRNR